MLEQIVYTRCKPCYDLEHGEKLIISAVGGHGFFNYSLDVSRVLQEKEYKKLLKKIPIVNASPQGERVTTFTSYEYFFFSNNKSAISYDYTRPYDPNGKEKCLQHRICVHVKQTFLGELEGYPCEFFGCSSWDAWKIQEKDYYLDTTGRVKEPPRAKCIKAEVTDGDITYELVRDFINENRKEILKKAIWFLLKEFEIPEEERKVLLIKDHPDNVAKWIAAINYALSPEMARQISFNTNVAGLDGNHENILFYKESSSAVDSIPCNMIVGYTLGSFNVFPISRFRVLDGEKNTFEIEVDSLINRPYFNKILEYSADTKDFCREVLPGFGIERIDTHIFDYYDAYTYLLEQNHTPETWEYDKLLYYLSMLTENGKIKNIDFLAYLLTEGSENYSKFFIEDLNKTLKLFSKYVSLAKLINQENSFLDIIAEKMYKDLNDPDRYGNELRKIWMAIKEGGFLPTFKPILDNLFNDTELLHYQKNLQKVSPENVYTIYEIYLFILDMGRVNPSEIIRDKVQIQFIYSCILSLLRDESCLKKALQLISRKKEVYENLLLGIPNNIVNNKEKEEKWWNVVMQLNSENRDKLFSILINSPNASFANIENLLSQCIRESGRCDQDIFVAFSQALRKLKKEQESGLVFFNTWLQYASQDQWEQIIETAKDLDRNTQCQIFKKLELRISLDEKIDRTLFESLKKWSSQLNVQSNFIVLAQLKADLMSAKKPDVVEELLEQFCTKDIIVERSFYRSNCFSQFIKKIAKFNQKRLNFQFLICFTPRDNTDIDYYIATFIEEYLECGRSKNKIEEFLVLYENVTMNDSSKFLSDKEWSDIQTVMKKKLDLAIPEYYKKNMIDMVGDAKTGKEAEKIMIEGIKRYEEESKKKSKSKGFNISDIFSRLKK